MNVYYGTADVKHNNTTCAYRFKTEDKPPWSKAFVRDMLSDIYPELEERKPLQECHIHMITVTSESPLYYLFTKRVQTYKGTWYRKADHVVSKPCCRNACTYGIPITESAFYEDLKDDYPDSAYVCTAYETDEPNVIPPDGFCSRAIERSNS